MLLAKLYTERRPNLPALVARHFDGATIYDAVGLWQGQQEYSAVIEIVEVSAAWSRAALIALAEDICAANNQSSVLVVIQSDGIIERHDVRAPIRALLHTREQLETADVGADIPGGGANP